MLLLRLYGVTVDRFFFFDNIAAGRVATVRSVQMRHACSRSTTTAYGGGGGGRFALGLYSVSRVCERPECNGRWQRATADVRVCARKSTMAECISMLHSEYKTYFAVVLFTIFYFKSKRRGCALFMLYFVAENNLNCLGLRFVRVSVLSLRRSKPGLTVTNARTDAAPYI